MKKLMSFVALLQMYALQTGVAWSHAGHDHAAPESDFIHMSLIAAPIMAVAALYVIKKMRDKA